jgi:hypothetical protein
VDFTLGSKAASAFWFNVKYVDGARASSPLCPASLPQPSVLHPHTLSGLEARAPVAVFGGILLEQHPVPP